MGSAVRFAACRFGRENVRIRQLSVEIPLRFPHIPGPIPARRIHETMNEDTPISRRNAMVAMSATLAAFWTATVAGLAALFVTTPLRAISRRREAPLGALTGFTEKFRAMDVQVPVNDGRSEERRVGKECRL